MKANEIQESKMNLDQMIPILAQIKANLLAQAMVRKLKESRQRGGSESLSLEFKSQRAAKRAVDLISRNFNVHAHIAGGGMGGVTYVQVDGVSDEWQATQITDMVRKLKESKGISEANMMEQFDGRFYELVGMVKDKFNAEVTSMDPYTVGPVEFTDNGDGKVGMYPEDEKVAREVMKLAKKAGFRVKKEGSGAYVMESFIGGLPVIAGVSNSRAQMVAQPETKATVWSESGPIAKMVSQLVGEAASAGLELEEAKRVVDQAFEDLCKIGWLGKYDGMSEGDEVAYVRAAHEAGLDRQVMMNARSARG